MVPGAWCPAHLPAPSLDQRCPGAPADRLYTSILSATMKAELEEKEEE